MKILLVVILLAGCAHQSLPDAAGHTDWKGAAHDLKRAVECEGKDPPKDCPQ